MGYINSDELKRLKQTYKSGRRVRAVNVKGIDIGTEGVVKGVRSNGSIVVLWGVGYTTSVEWGEECIAVATSGNCLLEHDMTSGGCDGSFCSECGWNSEVAEKRVKKIRNGGLVEGKNGIRKLIIRRDEKKK